jgi:hypothetical protein
MGDKERCESCENSCKDHNTIEDRVCRLEDAISEIRLELKQKAITDAKIEKSIEIMTQTIAMVQTDTKELRGGLLDLVSKTLQKTQEDMANYIKMNDKSDEKDREHQRLLAEKELEITQRELELRSRSDKKEKDFYRKLIIACFAIGGTIVLTFFGIKALIPIF